MHLFNTLSRSEEEFAPADGKTVRMYTCGLTVYARGHIGNFRTFVSLDVLRRALKYQEGYEVRQVTNFTDVDDKTIAASEAAGVSLREYTDRYIEAFREDIAAMGLEPAEEYPRATDEANLRAMTGMIEQLEARGHTYRSEGSIYFRIASLPAYGKLARLDPEGIQAGARVDLQDREGQGGGDYRRHRTDSDRCQRHDVYRDEQPCRCTRAGNRKGNLELRRQEWRADAARCCVLARRWNDSAAGVFHVGSPLDRR